MASMTETFHESGMWRKLHAELLNDPDAIDLEDFKVGGVMCPMCRTARPGSACADHRGRCTQFQPGQYHTPSVLAARPGPLNRAPACSQPD